MSHFIRNFKVYIKLTVSWAVLIILFSLATSPAAAQSKKPFRAGAAKSNITPQLGSLIVGGFRPFPATHIHDELYARCLVLDDGKTKLVFVVCDLLGFDRMVSDHAREILRKDLGISPANILISATHTHSACTALGKDSRKISHTMSPYQRFVALRIVDGVKRAVNLLRPAQIGWGKAMAPEHVFNRRWFLKPGKMRPNPFGGIDQVRMNPPRSRGVLLKPAGPTDPEVPFLVVREPDGKPISVLSTYSLHYVGHVVRGHVSADYFGMFCDKLSRLLEADNQKPAFVALMANGTSGDINNISFLKPRPRKKPYEQMQYVAHGVAQKVHEALGQVKYHNYVPLDALYREPEITTRREDAIKLLSWAKKKLADTPKEPQRLDLSYHYAKRTLLMAKHPEKLKIPLQVFRIGDVAVGAMPCEVFCEIGLDFKKRSPLKPAWIISLAHGYYGYLPTPRHHKLGGYETWLGTNRLETGASEIMTNDLLEMSRKLSK